MNFPLAFNIAFIPEDSIVEHCQQISKSLVEKEQSPYLLGRDGFPHITLLQGVIEDHQSFEALADAIEQARDRASYPTLSTEGYYRHSEESSLWWKVANSSALQAWHERVLALAKPYLCKEPNPVSDMFANSSRVREQDLNWVRHFGDIAVQDNFLPHITLGYGNAPDIELIASFKVGYLGLFQLGPFCSCYNRMA